VDVLIDAYTGNFHFPDGIWEDGATGHNRKWDRQKEEQ